MASPQSPTEPKLQATSTATPVVEASAGSITPTSPTTPISPAVKPAFKNRPFSNVTQMSMDPASPTSPTHPAGSANFFSKFWSQRSPASKNIPTSIDEKLGTTATVTPDDVSELEDLETHWHMISETAQRQLGKDWKPTWQLRSLFWDGFRDWLMVVVLLVALWAEIYAFSEKAVLTKGMKNAHNFLNTGLSMAIGIAIATGLVRMMENMRWWFLSLKKHSPYEVSLILNIASLRDCCRLIWQYPRGIAPVCILWLIINIGMQIAIATQGLTLTVDAGAKIALTKPGLVSYAPMQTIDGEGSGLGKGTPADEFDSQCFVANSYGNAGLLYKMGDISQVPVPKTLYNSPTDSYTYFVDSDGADATFQYVFLEANPDILNEIGLAPGVAATDALPISVYTNRTLNVTASCTAYVVSQGGAGWSQDGNITVLLDGDGSIANVSTPISRGSNVTQYWVEDANDKTGCGPGCAYVNAFESSDTMPWFYACEVTVSEISNPATPEQQISDDVRRIAAQAIALQGFTFFESAADERAGVVISKQFQAYPARSYWGFPMEGYAAGLAAQISQFAVLTVATTALSNSPLTVLGEQPQRGEALTVEWDDLYLILGLIAGVQLFFMIITSLVANLVFIKDGNHLSIARFLRPMVDRLGPSGNAADGKQIARALDEDNTMVVYSVRHPDAHRRHHLDLGVQRRLRAFPRGNYD